MKVTHSCLPVHILPLNTPDPCVFWLGRSYFCSECGSIAILQTGPNKMRVICILVAMVNTVIGTTSIVLLSYVAATICCHCNENPLPLQFRPNYRTVLQEHVSNWHGSYCWIQCGRHGVYASCATDPSCTASTESLPDDCGPNVVHLLCGSICPPLASSKVLS
jgi:hypothetical protein